MTRPLTSSLETFSLARLLDNLHADLPQESGRSAKADRRPQWLGELTDCIAEMFEPLRETARVGYDCRPVDGRWSLDVFLGPAERIGGPQDGLRQVPSFRFDLRSLFRCFDRVDGCEWLAAPAGEMIDGDENALPPGFGQLQVEGEVHGEPLRVTISSLPPREIGLGLRIFEDGEVSAV